MHWFSFHEAHLRNIRCYATDFCCSWFLCLVSQHFRVKTTLATSSYYTDEHYRNHRLTVSNLLILAATAPVRHCYIFLVPFLLDQLVRFNMSECTFRLYWCLLLNVISLVVYSLIPSITLHPVHAVVDENRRSTLRSTQGRSPSGSPERAWPSQGYSNESRRNTESMQWVWSWRYLLRMTNPLDRRATITVICDYIGICKY